jgi:arabinose operon protein AraL
MKTLIDGFVFDLDGTIYLGDHALPGAIEALRTLRQHGKRIVFVSNKPLQTRRDYAAKLTDLGIAVDASEVITSGYVLGHYLAKVEPRLRLYIIGEKSLRDELRSYGLTVVDEFLGQDSQQVIHPINVDAVVVAFDRTLDYRKLNTAYQALLKGARFFATNADKACPMPGGAIPDAGGTIAALEHMTGRKLELLAGKPSALMMHGYSHGTGGGHVYNRHPDRSILPRAGRGVKPRARFYRGQPARVIGFNGMNRKPIPPGA